MTTPWTLPNTITQYPETGAETKHVSWAEIDNFNSLKNLDLRSIKTSRDLVHIARDPRSDIQEKTYYLKITNFQFLNLPETLAGIEVKISMNRYGRITDDEIFLTYNNEIIGENQATLMLDPIKVYGNDTDVWNTSLTIPQISENSFGVVCRFRSHPSWPHKSSALIDAIEIRIH